MDRLSYIIVLVLFVLMTVPAFAQKSPTLQNQAAQLAQNGDEKNFFSLSIENDSLGGGTDRDYTSGVRITYFDFNAPVPSVIDNIADYVPTFDINETSSIAWSLGQNLYTPADIGARQQDPNDRPWAAWLYAAAGLTTVTDNHIDELELTLGIVGPAALGEPAQKSIHSLIESANPNGWDNQLDNEPGAIVSWRRRWPRTASFETMTLYGSLEPNFNISLGNIYSYAGAGMTIKLSPLAERWQDHPPRVRPAIPGTGYFQLPRDDWSWYLFAGADGRAIARNIFLDGNTFSDSHSVDKKYFVADLNAGIALTYKRTRLSYSLVYRTEEFHGQDDPSVFGVLSLSYRF